MRLFLTSSARRFVSLAILLFFAVPFGLSVSGCHKTLPIEYCNGGDSGPEVGQVATITLSPTLAIYGESLDYGQIGQTLSAAAQDCKGNNVSVRSFVYATSNMAVADINPSTGQVCAGTWNRNTGGGVPNFTTCTAFTTANPPASTTAAVSLTTPTASGAGTASTTTLTLAGSADIVSGTLSLAAGLGSAHTITVAAGATLATLQAQINGDATFIAEGVSAPTLTTNVLTISGPAKVSSTLSTAGTSLIDTTPGFLAYVTATGEGAVSNAIPIYIHPIVTSIVIGSPSTNCATDPNPSNNCCPYASLAPGNPQPYIGSSCISQGITAQLSARVYANGGTTNADNITCQVGHLSFSTQGSSGIASIDENGVVTANQPGSAIITATIAQSGSASTAGFFSTCPPASITLSAPGQTGSSFSINLNNSQPFTAVVKDTNGTTLNGVNLEYNSTSQQTIPTSSNSVTPAYPGTATITAVCLPGSCNPSPYSQINYNGNGTTLTSNGITVSAVGTSSTVLFIGSTSSQYIYPVDFTTNQPASLIKLPYVPNSMVINQAGTEIYLGSPQGLMSVSALTNAVSSANTVIVGPVISISPDGNTLVLTDPNRKTISLVSAGGGTVESSYNGVATRASWSPDAQTVYITGTDEFGNNQLLVHSTFNGWTATPLTTNYTDVAVTVPHIGAYFAGGSLLDGRTYCPLSTATLGNPPTVINSFYPLADEKAVNIDRLTATTNGNHFIAATATAPAAVKDIAVSLPVQAECPKVTATQLTNTLPTFTSSITSYPLTGITTTGIIGVLPSNNSALAFVTYTGSSGKLPYYIVPATGNGTLGFVTLGNGATTASAPVAGVFSTDNFTFYVGTSGDNQVHEIALTYPTTGVPTATETTGVVLTPNLPVASGTGIATPNLLVQRPKKSTE